MKSPRSSAPKRAGNRSHARLCLWPAPVPMLRPIRCRRGSRSDGRSKDESWAGQETEFFPEATGLKLLHLEGVSVVVHGSGSPAVWKGPSGRLGFPRMSTIRHLESSSDRSWGWIERVVSFKRFLEMAQLLVLLIIFRCLWSKFAVLPRQYSAFSFF